MSKVRRHLHWKPHKPLTAVKVNAGLKAVYSKSHKPPPLLHLCSLTELKTDISFFKRHFRALIWGSQIITLCKEHNSGTKLFPCSVELLRGCTTQHLSNTPGEGFPTMLPQFNHFLCKLQCKTLPLCKETCYNNHLSGCSCWEAFMAQDTWQPWGGVCITQVLSKCMHPGQV